LANHAKKGTKLFISGFYLTDLPDLSKVSENANWKLTQSYNLNGWCAALLEF
jgi:hypothetical protein